MKPKGFIDIKDFEELYAININGDIYCYEKDRGLRGKVKERIMKKYSDPVTGYIKACLYKNKQKYWRNVHRLTAEAFIPNTRNYPCINHKDYNKRNNNINNLEWCTYPHNLKHSYANGRNYISAKQKNNAAKARRKLTWDQALEVRALYKTGKYSSYCLGAMFGMNAVNIRDIINFRTYRCEVFKDE